MLYLRFQRYSIIAREDRTRQGMVSIAGDRAKHALRAIRTLTVMVLSHVPLPVGVRRQTQCLLGARPGLSALPESAGRASGTWEAQSGQQGSNLRRKFPKLLLYHFTMSRERTGMGAAGLEPACTRRGLYRPLLTPASSAPEGVGVRPV